MYKDGPANKFHNPQIRKLADLKNLSDLLGPSANVAICGVCDEQTWTPKKFVDSRINLINIADLIFAEWHT